jgi:hypothetical protein
MPNAARRRRSRPTVHEGTLAYHLRPGRHVNYVDAGSEVSVPASVALVESGQSFVLPNGDDARARGREDGFDIRAGVAHLGNK